jgi:hypothetical protein
MITDLTAEWHSADHQKDRYIGGGRLSQECCFGTTKLRKPVCILPFFRRKRLISSHSCTIPFKGQ